MEAPEEYIGRGGCRGTWTYKENLWKEEKRMVE